VLSAKHPLMHRSAARLGPYEYVRARCSAGACRYGPSSDFTEVWPRDAANGRRSSSARRRTPR
jgi:hypothetical protein